MRLIDADALLEELKKTDRYFIVKFDIESAPTIERPHGEWILIDDRDFPRCKFQCSICGSRFDGYGAYRDNDTKEWKPVWNFCWNCGSDNRKQGKGRRTCGLLDDEAFWD